MFLEALHEFGRGILDAGDSSIDPFLGDQDATKEIQLLASFADEFHELSRILYRRVTIE